MELSVGPTIVGYIYQIMYINNHQSSAQEVRSSAKRIHCLEDFLLGYDDKEISNIFASQTEHKRLENST